MTNKDEEPSHRTSFVATSSADRITVEIITKRDETLFAMFFMYTVLKLSVNVLKNILHLDLFI